MTTVTLGARDLTAGIPYTPFKTIEVQKEEWKAKTQTNFLADTLIKEVMQGTDKEKYQKHKQLRKLQKQFISILGAGAALTTTGTVASAATVPPPNGTIEAITPAMVSEWGMTVSLITVALGVAISGTLLASAGIYRMFRKREEATTWTTDIIKGLVQVLISVPTVYALFYLSQIVFQGLPMFDGLF